VWRSLLVGMLWMPLWAVAQEVQFSAGIESFRWEEFDRVDGHSLLQETGKRHFFGVKSDMAVSPVLYFGGGARLFSGVVDYDGETQLAVPAFSRTKYQGWNIEADFSRLLLPVEMTKSDRTLWITMGLGHERWVRDIRDGETIYGDPVAGYVEEYAISYARLGTKYADGDKWSLSGGIKYPIHAEESIGFGRFGYDDPELEPEGVLSFYTTLVYQLSPSWSIDMRYDSYRFERSAIRFLTKDGTRVKDIGTIGVCEPDDPVKDLCVMQPQSHQDTLSLMMTMRF